ncbi:hypothetical protein CLV28_1544 [Sediminihabitans luteus]|uniref:DUF308 domain-containing protein n=1 Tax=Sediminihabitans luteus TaxID=1138585 RepID=A0A2M9CQE2_9CELL|nr:hypothetical protein [Sediminihabitans luteus]PJJ74055.1 hypothetical protein CLV28_1544 [Sediminihabitans luteus]GII98030.1 hypothetical protein Slu03_04080 [Sediminihabitans luteus]
MAPPNAGQPEPGADSPGEPDETPAAASDTTDAPPAAPTGPSTSPSAGPSDQGRAADDDLDVESRWADIVAELGDVRGADLPGADLPGADVAPAVPPPSGRTGPGGFPVAPWVQASGPRDYPTTPEVEDLEDEESHFRPPEPPALTGRDPLLTLAWGLVAVTPLVLLVTAVLADPFPRIVAQLCGAGFVAGVGVLVWRMPHRRDPEDHDPGAVV